MVNGINSLLSAIEGALPFVMLSDFWTIFIIILDRGSTLVMTLARAQRSGEGQFINRYVCITRHILTVDEVNSFAVPLVKKMSRLSVLEHLTTERIVRL